MLRRARQLGLVGRYFGPGWLLYRAAYSARTRAGLLQRATPVQSWERRPLSTLISAQVPASPEAYMAYRRTEAPPFFFKPSDRKDFSRRLEGWDSSGNSPVEASEELAAGRVCYFSHKLVPAGFPPDWHANPFSGDHIDARRHWSRIGDFDAGDIKVVWEPSRFGFAYHLVRAYWRTGDERYPELFWEAVESWRLGNPPQQGPNWKCGQETSIRVMAWCFGLYAFLDSQATTARRVANLAQMIGLSGERIYANRSYALHQHNNHGISEGMGLWTIGTLFPEMRESAKWKREGRRMLEKQGRELIYEDGSFSQHSVNYQRMMLQCYTWALRLGELNGAPFSKELRRRVGLAGRFLFDLQDEKTGRLPNYGHNDGSLVLPLDNCGYLDYRPVIQAVTYLTERCRAYAEGPWDEDLLWLFGKDSLPAPRESRPRSDLQAKAGGYYTVRSESGFAFVRCASYRDRPAQADMLHVDIWWRGENIALDPGTFSYNAPPPMDLALAGTACHNTVMVDGQDQMERVSRFIWLPWLKGTVRRTGASPGGQIAYWEGQHNGYERLSPPVSHRRAVVRLGEEHWIVLDSLESTASHEYRLHWLLKNTEYSWDVDTATGVGRLVLESMEEPYTVLVSSLDRSCRFSIVRGDEDSPRGWQSLYYMEREPALSVEGRQLSKAASFWTVFGPSPIEAAAGRDMITLQGAGWQAAVHLNKGQSRTLVSRVDFEGKDKETLLISEIPS